MDQENGKKWEMPEPIFRKSTGELVKPSDSVYFDPEPDTLEPNSPDDPDVDLAAAPDSPAAAEPDVPSVPALRDTDDPLAKLYDPPAKAAGSTPDAPPAPAATPPAVVVEPQPFISEQFSAEKIAVDKDVLRPAGTSRSGWIVIAILLVLAAAGGLAALVYFMYFTTRANSSGF